ncbi:putative ABC exporter domain-containing protein [Opitutus terrae]|uniref:Putative ABC transporter, permease protein n=1 Tax=Opitutus terrae (strain DSM 11246 / JCM 15787 / PB90-1) TaxID=452637 RepID=B1ZSU1_OPITP|nr:putative ABC exporter domain-containing protein [Opitutus terrae]ACB74785.1 putative ABC transporter, permease protein [Opitutus terrae PB90-1]
MVSALLYLRWTSLRNAFRAHAARLRRPKYLAGFLFAAAYFYFFFMRPAASGLPARGAFFGALPADATTLLLGAGALALFVIISGMWLLASGQPGIRFTEAEIAFLFPAPVSRRTLVHYKLLSALAASLIQTLFFALIFNSRALFSVRVLYILAGWWIVLTFLNFHYMATTLTTARLAAAGFGQRRRLAVGGTALLAVAGAVALWTWRTQPDVLLAPSLTGWARDVLTHGPLGWVLAPFRWLVAPFFAGGPAAFLLAIGPALALLAAHYVWVVRLNVSFEEAAIAAAARRAAQVTAALRTGKRTLSARTTARRDPFSLALARWPELAFLWKNLLSSPAWLTWRAWLNGALVIIVGTLVLQRTMGDSYWLAGAPLATASAMGGLMALFYGPLLTRMDLRQDLANADVLKTYPLAGWRIVLGELLAPTAIIAGIIWLAILAWLLGLWGQHPPQLSEVWFSPHLRVILALAAAATAPFLVALELLVPNAAPVLLPGWFHSLRTPAAGIDLMGQRLIFGFGQVLVVLLALLPAAIAAALLGFIVQAFAGPAIAIVVATIAVILVLVGELWCGVWVVGRRFERLDLVEARP